MGKYLIVGSSSGIGAALATKFLSEGHEVIGISRTNRNQIAQHYALDIFEENVSLPALEGPLNGIAYCIGSITLKPFKNLKDSDFFADFKLNVIGAVTILQHYFSLLQGSESASVLLFSSVAAQTGMPFHASIASAKGAVEGLVRSLAAEWAPKIRVNGIAPSLTDTPLANRLLDTDQKRGSAKERHPLKEIGDPADMASLAYFLMSPAGKFVTGQIYKVDGGISSLRS